MRTECLNRKDANEISQETDRTKYHASHPLQAEDLRGRGNFEGQKAGSRTLLNEIKTWAGSKIPGNPFWVEFGLLPPIEYRPRH